MQVKTFRPMKGKIFVTEMDEGVHRTAGGIILTDDTGSERGIRDRWGRVAFIGEGIDDVAPGDWVLITHGRWTQRLTLEIDGAPAIDIWMVDPEAIIGVSDKNHSHERIKL